MSVQRPNVAPLPEDARILLADSASSAERSNQPRYLVVLALGLVAVALVVTLLAWVQRASAEEELVTERAMTFQITRAVDELLAAKAEDDEFKSSRYSQDPFIVGKIETLARDAGLEGVTLAESDDSRTPPENYRRRKYSATLQPQEAEPLLTWINRALADIPGLELSSLEVQPGMKTLEGKPRFIGSVVFTRWERRNAP